MGEYEKKNIAGLIDHTLLKAAATAKEIEEYCRQAVEHRFAAVCVNPCYVKLVAEKLKGTEVKVCTVVGFPLGANTPEVKAYEAAQAVAEGAVEVDMVINIGALKEGKLGYVEEEIRQVVQAAQGALVKVIIETCYLSDEEKVLACLAAQRAGAHFVKTSTGFGTGGATVEDVALLKKTVGSRMGVKASGGIKNIKDAEKMLAAGADRIGTSSGIALLQSEIVEIK